MSSGRRTTDRRRRVLYSAGQAETVRPTAASRREAERLREARRPIAAYGSRVNRRIRARWYSLVPVHRRTLYALASLLMGFALLLSGAHYAAVTWPSLAYHSEIARPLRIDAPDSFARWFTCALLAGCSGASLMIYQLRRYRVDDYHGRYRLWRLVLVVMLIASVNALVSIVDWSGAILDACFGKRVALTGGDWIHLVVSIGGAVLALRLLAELWRCRMALGMMALSCLMLAIPEAVRWNVIELDTIGKWSIATSAPLIAYTSMFIALGAYLRLLYREVRQIEDSEPLRVRVQQMGLRVFQRSAEDQDVRESEPEEELGESGNDEPKKRWWHRSKRADDARELDDRETEEQSDEEYEQEVARDQEDEDVAEDEAPSRRRRKWFGRKNAKAEQAEDDSYEEDDQAEEQLAESEDAPPVKKKRGWFSMRLQPKATENPDEEIQADRPAAAEEVESFDEEASEGKRKRFGLGGWLGGRKKTQPEVETDDFVDEDEPHSDHLQNTSAEGAEDDEEWLDPDSIDWDSLNKSERRRLRKQIKRQRRAA
ncbi:MAG: hypothetical protein AB8B91_21935 [Rubripirellula sp.]